jgi:hypothetical protein
MIHFVTLFLTLTLGSHPVEIAVTDDRVAAVEILLDGRWVGTATGTEWIVECDFGDDLRPHLLVAVARDAEGREIDRVEQRVNLPRPVAEVGVALEGGGADPYRARILWESVDRSQPTRVSLVLDGVALEGEFDDVVELPVVDDSRVHILEAELALNETVLARSEVAFGGPFGAEVSTELTAIPLELVRGSDLPEMDDLERWIRAGGRPVKVVGVEREAWDVLLVRDREARGELQELAQRAGFLAGRLTRRRNSKFLRRGLRETDSVRFVLTSPRVVPSGDDEATALFHVSPNWAERSDGSVPWILLNVIPVADPKPQHFAWAVASAGLTLAGGHRPRAVVLVKEPETHDAGEMAPSTVQGYLETLMVPLFVWRVSKNRGDAPDDGWGEGWDASSLDGLNRAVRDLRRSLKRQFIVWIEGDHMPQELQLTEEARSDLRFAGRLTE